MSRSEAAVRQRRRLRPVHISQLHEEETSARFWMCAQFCSDLRSVIPQQLVPLKREIQFSIHRNVGIH